VRRLEEEEAKEEESNRRGAETLRLEEEKAETPSATASFRPLRLCASAVKFFRCFFSFF
jgi:hypothetical protein